jgi:RimJ/RimL family protein N-acetyltransferase
MKVAFRPVRVRDLKRLNEIVNEPDVSPYLNGVLPISMKSTLRFFKHCKDSEVLWYCIVVDGVIVGSTSLHPERKDSKNAHVASFGIAISREYWGRGVGGRAVRFILRMAKELGLKKVILNVVTDNRRARALYERHGFVKEGLQRKQTKLKGRYHDNILMGRFL